MVDNLLCSVEASKITRIDVIFSIKESTFDTFIGRTGHVKFLCDEHFLNHFAITLDHLLLWVICTVYIKFKYHRAKCSNSKESSAVRKSGRQLRAHAFTEKKAKILETKL